MALPNEYLTENGLSLQQLISTMSEEEIRALPDLDRDDHEMIGHLIQSYNFIDLNLRRAIEIFRNAESIAISIKKDPLRDSELTEILIQVITNNHFETNDVSTFVQNLNFIAYGRAYRNLVAHFSARRFPGQDFIVFATKNEKDAKKYLGRDLKQFHLFSAVAGREGLRTLTLEIAQQSNWLAHQIPVWFNRCVVKK